MNTEVWSPVPGLEDRLEVSSFGRVRTRDYLAPSAREHQPTQLRRGRLVSPWVGNNGYYIVTMQTTTMEGKSRPKFLVHRLVAGAFVPGWFEGATVDHIDGDKLNNHISNLRWVSKGQNTILMFKAGRGRSRAPKLADEDVPKVKRLVLEGVTHREIAEQFGVSQALVGMIANGKRRNPKYVRPATPTSRPRNPG